MTDYFSIYSLILNASIVVQLVIGILLLASIGSWVVIVEKWIVTNNALKEFFLFEQFFWSGESLKDIYDCLLYTSPSPRDFAISRMPSSA